MVAQRAAGVKWLHVHPDYLVTDQSRAIVRLAGRYRDGVLPERGGLQDQSAWLTSAIDTVLSAWAKLEAERWKKLKRD